MDEKNNRHIIFGLGQSGLSCARYFERISQPYSIIDTREHPPGIDEIMSLNGCQSYYFGDIENIVELDKLLSRCDLFVVSPGISLDNSLVRKALELELDVCGDVEIFARKCKKPIVAITGSNGKSTVTDLTDKLINSAGLVSQ